MFSGIDLSDEFFNFSSCLTKGKILQVSFWLFDGMNKQNLGHA